MGITYCKPTFSSKCFNAEKHIPMLMLMLMLMSSRWPAALPSQATPWPPTCHTYHLIIFCQRWESTVICVCVCVCVCMCVNMNCKNLNGKPTKTFSLSLAIHFFSPLPLVFPSQGGTGNTSENQMEIGYSHEKFQGL